jgi:hypothetical protein
MFAAEVIVGALGAGLSLGSGVLGFLKERVSHKELPTEAGPPSSARATPIVAQAAMPGVGAHVASQAPKPAPAAAKPTPAHVTAEPDS